ncbi:MAG: hypothetical protein RIR47_42 [Bacteroidota bacterium]|jgi:hypothetical protein
MPVDFATFVALAPFVTKVRKPILLRGRHGIGKSEVVYQTARNLGLPVVERRASQMTEGDLLGLPDSRDAEVGGKRVTTWNPPDWFALACASPVVLFIDEIDRATTEVRQGFFELTDSRKINGHTLHPDTLIFAAVNGGEDGSNYQVGEFDPAELDRWTVFDVKPTVEDWLKWAKDVVPSEVWDFINQNADHLEHKGDFEPNKVYPSRRSWARFSECLTASNLLAANPAGGAVIHNLANAFVGFEAAVKFNDFLANYERQVTVEDILDNGKVDRTGDFKLNEHVALVDKLLASGRLTTPQGGDAQKPTLTASQVQNLVDYWVTLPSEPAMKLFKQMGSLNVGNCSLLHGSTSRSGVTFKARLVLVLTGKAV